MYILVEDKPRNCGECLFCKRSLIDVANLKSIHQCELLNVELLDPSKVRIADCPLKEVGHELQRK